MLRHTSASPSALMRKTTLQQRWFFISAILSAIAISGAALLFGSGIIEVPMAAADYALLGALLLALLFAAWLAAGRVSRHIDQLTREIRRVSPDQTGVSLSTSHLREINDLGLALEHLLHSALRAQSTMADEVSSRRAAQQAESASHKLLREIIDLLPCVVFARRHDGELIFANRAVADLYGTSLKELLLGSFAQTYPGPKPDRLLFSDAREGEQAEVWFSAPQGNTHRFLVSRVTYLDNKATLVVGIDVTEEHNLQMQLQFSQRLEVIGTLAGGIAHDFNNLLTPILGYASLLMDSPLAADDKTKLSAILTAAQRARMVVQQILTFSRQQDTIPARTAIDISEVIEEAATLMRASIPAGIAMHTEFLSQPKAVIDPNQLHQVIVNLCTNAAQAVASDDGTISVRVSNLLAEDQRIPAHLNDEAYVCIEVADNGSGMPREVMNHIFEPFFTTKGVGEGSGLGLSVVHGIVTSHCGEITVESEESRGTNVRVLLPLAEQSSPQHPAPAPRIMLVDDDTSVLRVTQELLETHGFRVATFDQPTLALNALAADPTAWDVLITDHNMPAMTGAELARAVRAHRPEIPIILITGFADSAAEEMEGIDHKVMKPLTGRELSLIIQQSLAARHYAA